MRLRALFLGLLLALCASGAWAQCGGQPGAGLFCGNAGASAALPSWYTATLMFDRNFGAPSVQGTILNRGASVWSATAAPVLGLNGTAGGSLTLEGATSGAAAIGVKAAAGSTIFNLPVGNGSLNNVLITDGAGNTSWTAAGGGTVSSVGLSMPGIFSVANSPVTSTGTLTVTLGTEASNTVWAGPTTGAASAPTFRLLVGADLPNPSASTLGGVQSFAAVTSQWIRQISTSGVPTASQPAFTDISGTITPAQCATPTASTIGCVESYVAVAHQWINAISTAGVPSSTQPVFADIGSQATLAQLPGIGSNRILSNITGGTATPLDNSLTAIIDSAIGSTQGDVLYRSGTVWSVLAPGTNGQVLTTGGAAANPAWATVTGTGTVTSVGTGTGLTGGPVTGAGTISFANISTGNVLANVTGGSAAPSATTPSAVIDTIGSTEGSVLYRGASVWLALGPGTNGQYLQTQGAGSTPQWASNTLNGATGTLTLLTLPQGRLTLTTNVPVTTTDVVGATTVFYTPFIGDQVPIYDGSTYLVQTTFTQLSQATTDTTKSPAAVVASSVYDVFVWNDSGTIRATRGPPWSSDTSRGTGAGTTQVQQIQGIWTNQFAITNGPGANRGTLVGSIRSNGSSQITDSVLFRWVSNAYNAQLRKFFVTDAAASWNYNTATSGLYEQAHNSTSNQVDVLQTLSGGMAHATVNANSSNTNTGIIQVVGVGVGQVTINNADTYAVQNSPVANAVLPVTASYDGYPGLGRTFIAWLEYSPNTGTSTFYGGGTSPGIIQPGLSGWVYN